jgi:uncharacterized phage protein gp47/JayE
MTTAIEIPPFGTLYDVGKAAALVRTSKLNAKSFSPGYLMDVIAGLSAMLGEEAARIALELHFRTFFGTATGSDLDALALDHFGISRQAGVSAIGTVRFSRPTSTYGNVLIEAGTVLATADGTRFITTSEPLLTDLEIDADVRAEETGEAGNVDASTVTVLVTGLPDSTITVTNPEEMAGGQAQETDAEFRQRIINWFQTLRKGTPPAVEAGALWVAGVVAATIDETNYPPTVYIADASGSANTALVTAVQTELVNWRAAGVPVNVVGATVVYQDITIALTFAAGYDTSAVRDQVREAIVAAVNELKIAETLYRSTIVAAARGVLGVLDCVVTDPAGDVVPAANQLLRTSNERVTI